VRSSGAISPLYRELQYHCSNDNCAHVFVCGLSVIRTVRGSLMPNPTVALPFSPPRRAAPPIPANDDAPIAMPPAANDVGNDAMSETG
jgi:hypothetical protein